MSVSYAAYLKSKWWLSLRDRLLPCRCVGCLENDASELHHLNYLNLRHEGPEDLIPMCDRCHWLLHQHLKYEYPATAVSLAVQFTHDVWDGVFSAVPLDELLERVGWSDRFAGIKYPKKRKRRSKRKPAVKDAIPKKRHGFRCVKCGNLAKRGHKLCRRCKREECAIT